MEHLRSRDGRTRQARPSRRNQAAAPLPFRCYASAARCIVTGLRSCEPSGWTVTVQSKTSGQPGRFVTWTATSPVGWPCASRTASTRKAACECSVARTPWAAACVRSGATHPCARPRMTFVICIGCTSPQSRVAASRICCDTE